MAERGKDGGNGPAVNCLLQLGKLLIGDITFVGFPSGRTASKKPIDALRII